MSDKIVGWIPFEGKMKAVKLRPNRSTLAVLQIKSIIDLVPIPLSERRVVCDKRWKKGYVQRNQEVKTKDADASSKWSD